MTTGFLILTIVFIIVSAVMILIILVQRPQGGGLAGAFGGAGGGGTDTVFGGRVGDALTMMTVAAFALYLALAIGLNMMDNNSDAAQAQTTPEEAAATMPDASIPAAMSDANLKNETSAPATTLPITIPSAPSSGAPDTLPVETVDESAEADVSPAPAATSPDTVNPE